MANTFEVTSESEMLALSAQRGDFVIRSDLGKTFVLIIEPATDLANWAEDEPFRLRVMKAVTDCLKSITPQGGYRHDLSDFTDTAGRPAERVFRGRTVYGDNDPLPMLSILEDLRPNEAANGTSNSPAALNQFRILIQGFVPDDKVHPLDPAYKLSADAIKALVKSKKERFNVLGFGSVAPCVQQVSIGQPVHRPPDDDVSAVAYFLVPVTLTLAENLETPFA